MISHSVDYGFTEHRIDWRRCLGIGLGLGLFLLVFLAVQHLLPPSRLDAYPEQGPLLADCEGSLKLLAVHYPAGVGTFSDLALRQFLGGLDKTVEVLVVCPAPADFSLFRQRMGTVDCKLTPVYTGHEITGWARDRWLSLAAARASGPAMLLRMHREYGADHWPARQGDARVAEILANSRPHAIRAARSHLRFDGGDFVADTHTVFVTPRVLELNPGLSRDALRRYFESVFDRTVVLLEEAPPHHAGMFMMPVGERRVLVGDPSLVRSVIREHDLALPLPHPDRSPATQKQFDAVAVRCREAGYTVVRIPVMPDADGRTYLSYVNGLIDVREGEHIVYLPVFDGVEPLNRAAAVVWQELGYEVKRVNCTASYRHYGTLRCLVNVIARD